MVQCDGGLKLQCQLYEMTIEDPLTLQVNGQMFVFPVLMYWLPELVWLIGVVLDAPHTVPLGTAVVT